MFSLKIDVWSTLAALGVGCVSVYGNSYGTFDTLILRWLVRLCVEFPKTSMLKSNNKPLKHIKQTFFKDVKDLNNTLKEINRDPNLKCYGIHKDVALILQSLFHDREELLVDRMDSVVISKQGIEILIYTFDTEKSTETFDRSILVDINQYRNMVYQWRGMFAVVCSIVGLLVAGNDGVRTCVSRLMV